MKGPDPLAFAPPTAIPGLLADHFAARRKAREAIRGPRPPITREDLKRIRHAFAARRLAPA